MSRNRREKREQDAAMQVRRRMEGRGKRRLVKRVLERNAQWRRLVARLMAAGLGAVLAGQVAFSEAAVLVA